MNYLFSKYKVSLLLITLCFIVACSEPATVSPNKKTMTFKVDGKSVSLIEVSDFQKPPILRIEGRIAGERYVFLEVNSDTLTLNVGREYRIGGASTALFFGTYRDIKNNISYFPMGATGDVMTITEFTNNKIKGKFSFVGHNSDKSKKVSITDGEFEANF